jgi:cysteine desulfurase
VKRVYLDHAATTSIDAEALEAMMPYLQGEFGNPSSVHGFGQRARGAIDEARAQVAALIGARDSEIVFVGSGTEADNLAIGGVLRAAALEPHGDRTGLVTTSIEHHAVLNCAKGLDRSRHQVVFARADEAGRVDLGDFAAAVSEKTALTSVMWANNETGVRQPIDDVTRIAREKGALVHTDAVQAVGKVPIDTRRLDVDLLTLSAHKIHGPKGVGALYIRSGTRMTAMIRGGSWASERRRRSPGPASRRTPPGSPGCAISWSRGSSRPEAERPW